MVATPTERDQYPADLPKSRPLFVIKEAVYKVTNPLDGVFLDFHDVAVDLRTNQASIRNRQKNFQHLHRALHRRIGVRESVLGGPRPVL